MCEVFIEVCFGQNIHKWTNHRFTITTLGQKKLSTEGKQTNSPVKKKVLCATVSKESHPYSFLGHERTHHCCFLRLFKMAANQIGLHA